MYRSMSDNVCSKTKICFLSTGNVHQFVWNKNCKKQFFFFFEYFSALTLEKYVIYEFFDNFTLDIYIVQRTFQFSSWNSQKQNCQNECEAKIFLSICECILYHMPRLFDDINICGRANADCIAHVTREIQLKTNNSFICDCLPGCYAISYEAEISMAPLLEQPPLLKKKQMAPRNAALLHVFYKDFYFRSQKKEELIGFTEFLCKFCACISVDWSYYMRYFLRSSLPSYTDSLIPCTINYIKHFSGVNSSDTAYEMMI